MHFSVVFYFDEKLFPYSDERHFFSSLSPLYSSLHKQKIGCYYILKNEQDSHLYEIQSLKEQPTPSVCATFLSCFKDLEYIFKFTNSSKSSLLFVSNSPDILKKLSSEKFFSVGYSNTGQFLSVPYCFECLNSLDATYFTEIMYRYLKKPLPIAKTKHLYIREFAPWDLRALYELYSDHKNTQYLLQSVPSYEAFFSQRCAYIEKAYPFYGFGLWGVFLKETNQLIGEFGIQCNTIHENEEIEVGYLLDKNYQGKGYGKEALRAILRYAKDHLALDRIVARIHLKNHASLALATNCGFHFEQTYKKDENTFLLYTLSLQSEPFRKKTNKTLETSFGQISNKVYKDFQDSKKSFVYEKKYPK